MRYYGVAGPLNTISAWSLLLYPLATTHDIIFLIGMKRRKPMKRRPRPKLPKIPAEMGQWSDLLLREILGWPHVSSRPMFGMIAVYHGDAIFGVLPRTRAMDSPYSVSFKIARLTTVLEKSLKGERRILPHNSKAKWISFELQSGDDLPDAIRWFTRAYRLTAKTHKAR